MSDIKIKTYKPKHLLCDEYVVVLINPGVSSVAQLVIGNGLDEETALRNAALTLEGLWVEAVGLRNAAFADKRPVQKETEDGEVWKKGG